MKMRKTIYPIALIIAIPLVIILFYILNQGHYEQINTLSLIEDADNTFVAAHFEWKGYGHPKIKSIKLAEGNNSGLGITAYLSGEQQVGNDEKVSKIITSGTDLTELSIIIESIDEQPLVDTSLDTELRVRYKTFGITREQVIKLKS